jgi:sigma-B regulation protein RsbU (phosphoserine phosphatase)
VAGAQAAPGPDSWSIDPVQAVADGRSDEVGALARAFLDLDHRLTDQIHQFEDEVKAREQAEGMLRVAGVIQASMLPPAWAGVGCDPRVGLDVYARPAHQAGGDLYHFAQLDEDRVFIAIGDVSDKGVAAALFMAGTMTCLRSGSALFDRPADILAHANRVLSENNGNCMFVTLFAGIFDCRTGRLEFANAGHDPGLVRRGDAGWAPLPVRSGLALGVEPEYRFDNQETLLQPGDRLLLYTDGATDRRSVGGEPVGLDGLIRERTRQADGTGAMASLGRIIEGVGGTGALEDDITLVEMVFYGTGREPVAAGRSRRQVRTFALEPEVGAVARLPDELGPLAGACGWPKATTHDLLLALEEVIVNAIEHGFGGGERAVPLRGESAIQVQLLALPDRVEARVIDCGPAFNPLTQARVPDLGADILARPVGGLGLHIVRQLMDEVRYRRHHGRNHLLLVRHLPAATDQPPSGSG